MPRLSDFASGERRAQATRPTAKDNRSRIRRRSAIRSARPAGTSRTPSPTGGSAQPFRRRRAGCVSARLWVFASGKRRAQAPRPTVKDNRGRRPLRQDNRSTVGADSIRPRRTDLNDDLFQAKSLGFQICRRAVPWGRHHHFGRFGGGKPPPYGSLYVRRIIRGRPQVAPTGLSEMRRRHAAAHGWPPYGRCGANSPEVCNKDRRVLQGRRGRRRLRGEVRSRSDDVGRGISAPPVGFCFR